MNAALPEATDLVIVLPHLGAGGAQKVALLAAEHFQSQGLNVVLVTLLPGKALAHRLPANLVWLDLGPIVASTWKDRALIARIRRFSLAYSSKLLSLSLLLCSWPWLKTLRAPAQAALIQWLVISLSGPQAALLRDLFKERPPRIVLSMLTKTNLLCCQALWNLPSHLVISERNDPGLQRQTFAWRSLQSLLWHRANRITANTIGVLGPLKTIHPELAAKITLLPNPLPKSLPQNPPISGDVHPYGATYLLAVCRLVPQKGIDLLIQAYAMLDLSLRQNWPLLIAGDGPERAAFESLAEQCGVGDSVHFLGFVPDPFSLYQKGSVFILSSRFEGMPNALLEAMSQGLAVIVSDASPGPLEVVAHERTGLVVASGEVLPLVSALIRLMCDQSLRTRLGQAASLRISNHDWPVIEPLWQDALNLNKVLTPNTN